MVSSSPQIVESEIKMRNRTKHERIIPTKPAATAFLTEFGETGLVGIFALSTIFTELPSTISDILSGA